MGQLRRLSRLLVGLCLLTFLPLGSLAETDSREPLAKLMPGYSVARCLFPEGKLVLEKSGEFLVLRKGDVLPDLPRVKVLHIGEDRAVLAEASAASEAELAVPERMVQIREKEDGGLEVIEMSASPPREPLPVGPELLLPANAAEPSPEEGEAP